jgi:hypothetical protein
VRCRIDGTKGRHVLADCARQYVVLVQSSTFREPAGRPSTGNDAMLSGSKLRPPAIEKGVLRQV